jgi:type IV pilus assembly protein PilM
MNLLPKASGTRPRLACEIAPEGVMAARATTAEAALDSVARIPLAAGAIMPGLKPGNLADRVAVIAAIRRALESIDVRPGRGAVRSNSRGADLTVIIPDAAVRVLLLDFDALPAKLTEALPIVRFRLKKLLPFEADDAMISYQVMSSTRNNVRVLAVAILRDILAEYETAVREAGFEPGAVLPSTLAALAGLTAGDPSLVVNASHAGITTAITREGVLLLHRSVDLQPQPAGIDAALPPQLQELSPDDLANEIAQAVSVAVAYFEDTLSAPPPTILSAGALAADSLRHLLSSNGYSEADALQVRELIDASAFSAGAVTGSIPRGALAGVAGALRG